jgi:hypothetical protein
MEITIKVENKRIYNSLISLLKQMGIQITSKKKKGNTINKSSYPLKDSVLKFENPFDSATDDWEVIK